ncbi:MAG: type VI secretion system tip protein TssI/VgrG [Arcobacteraceae bacterium]|nr:type VI secretion system tip protein TssI/VgrG [Arcobacteraceae bacterium]
MQTLTSPQINQRINARINFIGLDELCESGTSNLSDISNLSDFSIYKLNGYSSVDSYYKFTILFVSDYDLVIEDIVDLDCCVRIRDEINSLNKKEIYAKVFKIREYSVVGSKRVYEAVIVSPLHYLSLNKHYEIYMDKSVKDIVSMVLGRYKALLGIDLVLKVDNLKYPIRHYTTQYAQSDYEFIKMLCEEEGLVILSDYSSNNPYGLVLCELNEHALSCESIEASFFASKKFALSNYSEDFYDYLKPSVDMKVSYGKNLEFDTYKDNSYTKQLKYDLEYEILRDRLETYDGSNAKDLQRYNEIDSQRGYSLGSRVDGVSYELSMRDGISIVLNDTKLLQEKEVIILSVEYNGHFPNALDEYIEDDKDKTQYFVQFSSIPKDHIYRPNKSITKPRINGIQTAIVSKGDNNTKDSANEIDVNHLGEIRVIMHFDYNRPTTCYIPLSNIYSGDNYGARFLPRVNSEVIVSYINGDIDRPIIIGSLHNGENKIPYPLPSTKTQSYIKTQTTPQYKDKEGYNEILFEDKPNNEQLNLRAQKDHSVLVLNNSSETIQNNKTKFVQNNEKNTIKGNQSTHIHKNKTETINIASALTIGAGYQISVGAGKNESVGGSSSEQVGVLKHVIVGDKYTIGVGKSSITMYSNGNIIIQGEDIPIIGSEHVQFIAPRVYIDKSVPPQAWRSDEPICFECMLKAKNG